MVADLYLKVPQFLDIISLITSLVELYIKIVVLSLQDMGFRNFN